MNKLLSIAFVLLYIGIGFSQNDSADTLEVKWIEKAVFSIEENEHWYIDGLGNRYISRGNTINKYSENDELLFSQSVKSIGQTSDLIMQSTLKLIHFSEEQQTLCYFDNTLSFLDDCLDLSSENIVNASLVSASFQPNKIWVLDNVNSTLNLLSLDRLQQKQQVLNLKGILELEEISKMVEKDNRLYLLDRTKGIYVFDIYGSLIEFFEGKSIQQFTVIDKTLFTLQEGGLKIFSLEVDQGYTVKLPLESVLDIRYINQFFYISTKSNVHKFDFRFL